MFSSIIFGEHLEVNFHESNLKNVNKCLTLAREFTENGSRERNNLSAEFEVTGSVHVGEYWFRVCVRECVFFSFLSS
jgi:hypothetical protein